MTKESRFAGTALTKGFQTDKDAEQHGVWRQHAESGIWAKIRRATLPEHRRAIRKHHKPFAHLPRLDPVDELRVKQKAGAEVLVADWGVDDGKGGRGPLTDKNGATIPCNQETVLEAFQEMPDFFEWVSGESDTFEHYRVEAVQESAGNSSRSSSGSANGEHREPALSLSDAPPEVSGLDRSSASQS